MTRRLAVWAAALASLVVAAPAPAAPRDLDLSFGGDGTVLTPIGVGDAVANAVARQPDGRIVAAGSAYESGYGGYPRPGLAITRYLPDGDLDHSFDGDGIVVDSKTPDGTAADAVAIQPDGKILVSGRWMPSSLGVLFVARYLPDGHRDETFGDGGVRLLPGSSDRAHAPGLALQSDGRVLVAGDFEGDGTGEGDGSAAAFVARFTTDGDLDPTYGSGGVAFVPGAAGATRAGGLVIQAGRAVIAGSIVDAGAGALDVMLARFDGNGAIDGTFGDDGVVRDRAGNDEAYVAKDVALWNGKLLVAGFRGPTPDAPRNYLLARFDEDGALDTTFNATGSDPGHVFAGAGDGGASADGLTVEPDTGRATLVGSATEGSERKLLVARYTSDGLRDDAGFVSSNGTAGPRLLDAGDGGETVGHDVLLDAAGKIVVAGSALDAGYRAFFLARLGDTPPTPNAPPIARISGQHRLPNRTWVRFDGFRSSDRDGRIVGYAWRVDGRSWHRVGPVFWHKFVRRGLHRIDLRVIDDDGARGFAKFDVRIVRLGG